MLRTLVRGGGEQRTRLQTERKITAVGADFTAPSLPVVRDPYQQVSPHHRHHAVERSEEPRASCPLCSAISCRTGSPASFRLSPTPTHHPRSHLFFQHTYVRAHISATHDMARPFHIRSRMSAETEKQRPLARRALLEQLKCFGHEKVIVVHQLAPTSAASTCLQAFTRSDEPPS